MKLLRLGDPGKERPAVLLDDDRIVDVSSQVKDYDAEFFADGGIEVLRGYLKSTPTVVNMKNKRIGPPVARPYKIIGIGLNYADHAKESGAEIPKEPVMFMKATNSLSGPYDDVLIPRKSVKTDWEVELGVVVGKTCRYLHDEVEAEKAIAGYCISNDVSEREFQIERGGSWDKGKGCETFNPLGPWLVTPDEVGDVQNLDLTLDLNGERKQTGNTKTMIFTVKHIVWYLSQFMALEPGDVITTGTPPGVGLGHTPPLYLRKGDEMKLTISGLGEQKQKVGQA